MDYEKKPDKKIQEVRPDPEQSIKQRVVSKLLYIALAIAALGVGIFLYWANQNTKVIHVNNQPFPVRTIREHPTAKGVVILEVDYCKLYDVEGELRTSFLNSTHEIFLPLTKERSAEGCHKTEFPIIIPDTVQPGSYRVKFRVVYEINPIKKNIVNEFVSKEFEVVK